MRLGGWPLQRVVVVLILCQASVCTALLERPYERTGSTSRLQTHVGTGWDSALPAAFRLAAEVDPGGNMLTIFEGILLICLISVILYWYLSATKGVEKKDLEERVVALERQQKELRNAIALLVFKSNAFETQLPLTPEQKQQIKSLEDQITVARYLDTIFPE